MRKATYNCRVGKINAAGGGPVNRHMINQRMFDHYGIDTQKDLKISARCGRPWDTVLIDRTGNCYACECQAWLPAPIGNLQIQSLADILAGDRRQHLQSSIQDGTYRYCNNYQCSYIQNQITEQHKRFTVRLAVDDSCNLACPSCRNHKIFVSRGTVLQQRRQWIDHIVAWIDSQQRPIDVVIGSDGDPFVSLVYRYFMQQAQQRQWSHVQYRFQTNGLLLQKMYHRLGWVFDRTKEIKISIDGTTAAVYEALRKGGRFQQLLNNFEFLSKLDRKFQIHLHMVVQQANWRQMPEMLELCDRYGFDRVYFTILQDWNTNLDTSQAKQFLDTAEYQTVKSQLHTHPKSITWDLP